MKLATRFFFDSRAVTSALDRASRRVLSRFGAFVRQRARTSIRRRPGTSAPGTPPRSHNGLLRSFILFGYDPARQSVVIGPARLTSKRGDAPAALEYGGPTVSTCGRNRGKRIQIRPRPFMGPALEAEQDKLPGMWADQIK